MHATTTIAIACESAEGLAGEVSGHFGRSPYFVVAELADGKVLSARLLPSPGHGPGCGMPAFVAELGVSAVVVGGIGPGASRGLASRGIAVVSGASGNAGVALEAFAKGNLITPEASAHRHGGDCGGHRGRGCGHGHP